MQDRFKLRIWLKDKNKMCTVHSLHIGTNKVIISSRCGNVSVHLDNNKILMQCTGLKDKHSKLIYEGDIVFVKVETQDFFGDDEYYSERYKGKIIFDKGEIVIDVVDTTKHTISLYHHAKNCEIIGNIYENEGLLKEVNNDNK